MFNTAHVLSAADLMNCSVEDHDFVHQSTEMELMQLFRVYDELCEQRQEMENKLDEAEDTQLPYDFFELIKAD